MKKDDESNSEILDIYEAFAEPYERLAEHNIWNFRHEQPAIRSLMPDISGKRVLDAGGGPGFLVERLIEPRPLEECKKLDPETYERLTTSPGFLCIRARKKAWYASL